MQLHIGFIWILLQTVLFVSCSKLSVPFLVWSDEKYLNEIHEIPASQLVDRSTLSRDVISKLYEKPGEQTIILFYFDKLSLDDISKYSNSYTPNSDGGALHNLKNLIQDSASHVTIPMISSVDPEVISSKASKVINYREHSSDWATLVESSKVDLLFVNFEIRNDVEESMRNADTVMAKITKQAKENGLHYTGILTAAETSKSPIHNNQQDTIVQIGRHLLADPTQEPKETFNFAQFNNSKCNALFFAENITVTIGSTDKKTIEIPPLYGWPTVGSTCDENTMTLKMQRNDLEDPLTNFELMMNFALNARNFWNISSSSVTYGAASSKVDLVTEISDTPKAFSFHCRTVSSMGKDVLVEFAHFQVQPFEVKENKFSDANDCQGFFTEGVWMALFVSLILLAILWFGVSMLASLKVMDRFDDPKGKTITVHTGD